jgi:transposase InsO family protein
MGDCPQFSDALENAFQTHGPPTYLITDQEGVFTGSALAELLRRWDVKQRFGAVGKHGSIAVTERVIQTLKHEWLRRVPIIRGTDHLTQLLDDFGEYYNHWRGHMTLGGAPPAIVHRGEEWAKPAYSAKQPPANIEQRTFADTRITAFRLAA